MDVLLQCSKCLEQLHLIKVVHRDVKSENFLMSRNLHDSNVRVVICDFGFSSVANANTVTANTNCGTTSYKAPEVVYNCVNGSRQKKVPHVA